MLSLVLKSSTEPRRFGLRRPLAAAAAISVVLHAVAFAIGDTSPPRAAPDPGRHAVRVRLEPHASGATRPHAARGRAPSADPPVSQSPRRDIEPSRPASAEPTYARTRQDPRTSDRHAPSISIAQNVGLSPTSIAEPRTENRVPRPDRANNPPRDTRELGHAASPSLPDDAGAERRARIAGTVRPRYPPISRRLGEQGLVLLRAHVLADGRVGEIRVERHPGSRRLVDAALEAVRGAEFLPAQRNGRPVASWLDVPVRFVLEP